MEMAPEKRAMIYPSLSAPARLTWMRSGNVRSLLNRIDEVYSRADLADLTGGALFYFEPGFELAAWFQKEVIERPEDHPRVAHVGPVWFYK
jgi:hypothetical protein